MHCTAQTLFCTAPHCSCWTRALEQRCQETAGASAAGAAGLPGSGSAQCAVCRTVHAVQHSAMHDMQCVVCSAVQCNACWAAQCSVRHAVCSVSCSATTAQHYEHHNHTEVHCTTASLHCTTTFTALHCHSHCTTTSFALYSGQVENTDTVMVQGGSPCTWTVWTVCVCSTAV
jgi:hypothetical protein